MGHQAAKPALFLLRAPDEQPKQPARNTGSGKPAQAAGTAERLTRRSAKIHLAGRRAARRCALSGLAWRRLGIQALAEKTVEEGLSIDHAA
jgi:hypothetical protein